MDPERLMQLAVHRCQDGISAGQTPFGCAIARDGEILAVAHNVVWATKDITAHAEITAIRAACRHTGEMLLEGAIVATTCEPCPMCAAALHWARVDTVYFGASISDATDAGFNELHLAAESLLSQGKSPVRLVGGVLADQCRNLFATWASQPGCRSY